MNIDNITSENITLNYDGKMKQIQIYEKEIKKLKKQLEAYENMRKEALAEITNNMQYDENIDDCWVTTYNLIDILNKVGSSDE